MPLILTINTAFETASVILSSGEEILFEEGNSTQKNHASFLEPAIQSLFKKAGTSLQAADAVSVVNGPGSYTGLRIGLSSAKALCYALKKPLILLNTLDVMALALKLQLTPHVESIIFCPLIDARRMEVFAALYDKHLRLIRPYSAEILNSDFLINDFANVDFVVLGGSGSYKLQKILNNEKTIYINPLFFSNPLAICSNNAFENKVFADLIYSEPFYFKPVYFKNQ